MRKENWSDEMQKSLKQARQGSHQFQISYIFAQLIHVRNLNNSYYVDFFWTERLLIQEKPTSSAVVAFYAYMSKSLPAYVATPHHVLICDVVRTNVGNAYHSSTGVFMGPDSGVYVFIWSFHNGWGALHSAQLMINSVDGGQFMLILLLQAGCRVQVQQLCM